MSVDNKLSAGKKVISVILGTLLLGFMWRARGTAGFGSSWGYIYVSTVATMLIFAFYGNREKMKYELFPIGTLMMVLTVPAWGEINQMMGGVIPDSNILESGGELAVINGFHALPLILMAGFSLVCLYSIFVGTLFSKRDIKPWHYLVYIAVFFAVTILAKLTFSHALLKVIAPEVTDSFSASLAGMGEKMTAGQYYAHNFFSLASFKKIAYGRAYVENIEHISTFFGAAAVLLTSLIAFRDRITFIVSFVTDLFAAIGFTAADIFNVNAYDGPGSILKNVNLPSFLSATSWPLWEYFTGAFIGLGIMLILALLPDSVTSGRKYRNEPVIRNKYMRFVYSLILIFGFSLTAEPVRCFGIRFTNMLEMLGAVSESSNETVSYIIMGVVGIIAFVLITVMLKKNIIDKSLPVPVKMKPNEFCLKFLPVYVLIALVFFLLPDEGMKENFFELIKNPAGVNILSGEYANIIAVCSVLLFFVIFIPVKKRILSRH